MSSPPGDTAERGCPDWSERRADARRNHEQIIAAAIAVFAEKGLNATVPEVAARAGVGKATVYRSYPTKADLIRAVAEHQVRWVEARLAAAAEESDPYAALRGFLYDVSERLADDQVLLAEVLPKKDSRTAEAPVSRVLAGIVDAAREQGTLRSDVTALDVRILVGGYARVLSDLGIRDPKEWRRYAGMVMAALRP
ncbi:MULTISPECIES: TetR/AcrR family transcriptional regulator [unclassified Parafrankia]|uniref:TetR/AcrR family transcriptional regulator n=1 Tax=unclassified Parafrankia TaxID=2994368 RepID=UPI000DA5E41C|nr:MULTISPECIES: TetR/AcrR family transcriptional regulator [unclassified Parafrankia]TCJ34792.1 TetR/AcrR family transcriptional regulator [Parafrankia sp. BMG5.11]SQD98824.1 Transcriptional regulator, TetR family [Parafrankia sp. Ea1.12]